MRNYLDQARQLERQLVDCFTNVATTSFERCQRRVEQLQMAIDSDLFAEFDEDHANVLRDVAASVRIKHMLLKKELDQLRRLSDDCDELVTIYMTAHELQDADGREDAAEKIQGIVADIREIHERSMIVCKMIRDEHDKQLTLFERMRMMTIEEAASRLGVDVRIRHQDSTDDRLEA